MQISRWRRGKTSPGRRTRNEAGFGRVIPGRCGGGPALTAGPRGSREQRGGELSHRDDIWLFPVNAGEKERIRARDARWQRIHREKLISKCGGSAEKKRRKSRNSKKKNPRPDVSNNNHHCQHQDVQLGVLLLLLAFLRSGFK